VTGPRLGEFAHDDARRSTTVCRVGQVRLDARESGAKLFQPRPVALQKLDGVGDLLGSRVQGATACAGRGVHEVVVGELGGLVDPGGDACASISLHLGEQEFEIGRH